MRKLLVLSLLAPTLALGQRLDLLCTMYHPKDESGKRTVLFEIDLAKGTLKRDGAPPMNVQVEPKTITYKPDNPYDAKIVIDRLTGEMSVMGNGINEAFAHCERAVPRF